MELWPFFNGALAHLVERLHGMQEVVSSSLICSTLPAVLLRGFFLERKSHRFRDGIFLFLLSIFSGTPEISDFWGEEE